MKRIALLLAVGLIVTSFTGCGCCRRIRGAICPGAFCGSRAPVMGSVRAPAPAPIVMPPQVVTAPPVVQAPQYVQPRVIRPQMVAPQCVPCCPCPCPTVCDPCCPPANECCTGYGSTCCDSGCNVCDNDCGCNAPFGIQVGPGEYFGGVQDAGGEWQGSRAPTDAGPDPGPAE
ncbi:hypothetical protein NG895_24310 [Aeoliella sp. ICT_H6.2]|uniref:Uncharacterized protein n=1 Tax=Aeoliella straminimaris TaxID=2954799 RepID=A0A9X2JIG5_9BACT|nr:hypothetical protein [Aeoliella straminimaris]MCO6047035.1 hypothetical protein [Aeoliella straminimaris]